MDKTLETVVIAAVVMMIAVVLFFLVSDSVGEYSRDTQGMNNDADCDYLRGQFQKEKAFGSCDKADSIKNNAPDSCDTSDWGECTEDSGSSS